jgi:hypothetical protein
VPGPMSRPDGHRESCEERKARGKMLMNGKTPKTGKSSR